MARALRSRVFGQLVLEQRQLIGSTPGHFLKPLQLGFRQLGGLQLLPRACIKLLNRTLRDFIQVHDRFRVFGPLIDFFESQFGA